MKKLRFLVSLMTRENDYQLEQAASAQQAATTHGIELQFYSRRTTPLPRGRRS
jgi:hypothetical protein